MSRAHGKMKVHQWKWNAHDIATHITSQNAISRCDYSTIKKPNIMRAHYDAEKPSSGTDGGYNILPSVRDNKKCFLVWCQTRRPVSSITRWYTSQVPNPYMKYSYSIVTGVLWTLFTSELDTFYAYILSDSFVMPLCFRILESAFSLIFISCSA